MACAYLADGLTEVSADEPPQLLLGTPESSSGMADLVPDDCIKGAKAPG